MYPLPPPKRVMDKKLPPLVASKGDVILAEGGVLKRIERPGVGPTCPDGSKASVFYEGMLMDGTEFDRSPDGKPFQFRLGRRHVLRGWDWAVLSMRKGEVALITCRPDYAYGEDGLAPKIGPNCTVQFRLELLDWDNQQKVTEDGGVLKRVQTRGTGANRPNDGAVCTVRYRGSLSDGTVFADSWEEAVDVTVGDDVWMVDGLEASLINMYEGEHSIFVLKPEYAYGTVGNPELAIGPDQPLQYEIHLLRYVKGQESWQMTLDDRIAHMERHKRLGNALFGMGRRTRATWRYKQALGMFRYDKQLGDSQRARVNALKVDCNSNLSLLSLKDEDTDKAMEYCTAALKIQPTHPKCLFRRAKMLYAKGKWREAHRDARAAQKHAPTVAAFSKFHTKTKAKMKSIQSRERSLYSSMFQDEVENKSPAAASVGRSSIQGMRTVASFQLNDEGQPAEDSEQRQQPQPQPPQQPQPQTTPQSQQAEREAAAMLESILSASTEEELAARESDLERCLLQARRVQEQQEQQQQHGQAPKKLELTSRAPNTAAAPPGLDHLVLSSLEEHLSKHSYVNGHVGTAGDMCVLRRLPLASLQGYPHLQRWRKHVQRLGPRAKRWPSNFPNVVIRCVGDASSGIDALYALEAASYPPDEAATRSKLEFRAKHASDFFLVAEAQRDTWQARLLAQHEASSPPTTTFQAVQADEPLPLVGFICGTTTGGEELTEETMSTHDPQGHHLCIHSVVVAGALRMQGLARFMLASYIKHVVDRNRFAAAAAAAGKEGRTTAITRVSLLTKPKHLALYAGANGPFTLVGPWAGEHGSEQWLECTLRLA